MQTLTGPHIMPAAVDTPMMQQWGIPAERMVDPSAWLR
jgi:hypothetical protein